MPGQVPFGKAMRKEFLFDEGYLNLNHGSFGTYPKAVRDVFRSYQNAAEARPDEFIRYDYPKLLDESRAAIAEYLNAPVETITYVPNATTGINTVLRNLTFQPGDKIIYFATIYGACEKTVAYLTETTPVEAVKIQHTYPISDSFVTAALRTSVEQERRAGNNPRLCIFDTITSLPGVRMPFEALTQTCRDLGILSVIDGAHGVGHIPLNLTQLDPDFLVSNCHKWLFVPRGCAVFYVPLRNQSLMRSTLPTSHGFQPRPRPGVEYLNPLPASDKSAYVMNFEFVGTIDPAPYLCVPAALKWRRETCGGEDKIREYCVELNKKASERVAGILGTEYMECEEGTLRECNMSNVRLPLHVEEIVNMCAKRGELFDRNQVRDWITLKCMRGHGVFMQFVYYNNAWWLRICSQIYLDLSDFEWAAEVLKRVCEDVRKGRFLDESKARL